jgi:hypothetical protein
LQKKGTPKASKSYFEGNYILAGAAAGLSLDASSVQYLMCSIKIRPSHIKQLKVIIMSFQSPIINLKFVNNEQRILPNDLLFNKVIFIFTTVFQSSSILWAYFSEEIFCTVYTHSGNPNRQLNILST